MGEESDKGEPAKLPARIIDTGKTMIDLSSLSNEQAAEIQRQYASTRIDLERKAAEAKIDVGSLGSALGTFNDEAAKATQSNVSITVSHRQKTSIGETEVVIGNTDRAAAGKLSMTAAGLTSKLPLLVGIIAIALVVIALIVTRH
jgi:hypothetical protein